MHHRAIRASRPATIATALAAALAAASPAVAQHPATAPAAAPSSTRTDSAAKDTTAKPHHSRFGRFGRVFEKAASTAADVGAKAGISKGTAARLAVTAATGGAAAALMDARLQGATAAATLAERGATGRTALRTAPSAGPSNALTQEAVRAMTDLGEISARAGQHDPAAVHALQALNAAMAKPNGEIASLQRQASAGDPTAAQKIVIREDAIARAALGGRAP